MYMKKLTEKYDLEIITEVEQNSYGMISLPQKRTKDKNRGNSSRA